MYGGYRVVVVTPAGRRRYLSILLRHLLRDHGLVDEWRLWENTEDEEDLSYIRGLASAYRGFVSVEGRHHVDCFWGSDDRWKLTYTIHPFFRGCCDVGTVYIRLDDDVVWLEPGGLERLIAFRVSNPGYFLVSGNVINNAICCHLHQRMGLVPYDMGFCGYWCADPLGWGSGSYAEGVHRLFLDRVGLGLVGDYHFGRWELTERFSINCISWMGREFGLFDGIVGVFEEEWLTVEKTGWLGKRNCVFGGCVVSHYAFGTQREHMDGTGILESYRSLKI